MWIYIVVHQLMLGLFQCITAEMTVKWSKKGSRDAAQQVVNMKDKKESLIRERNWRNKWTINDPSWTCVKCEWILFLCPDSKTLQSTNRSQSCIKNNDELVVLQISHVGPVNQELFPHSTVKYDNVADVANRRRETKNRREAWLLLRKNVLECFCKNSWPQHCRDEQWGQIMEIPTM